jgi:hypothetical protein
MYNDHCQTNAQREKAISDRIRQKAKIHVVNVDLARLSSALFADREL